MKSEAASGVAGPGAPRAAIQSAKLREKIAGGQIFGIVPVAEDGAKVGKHLKFRAGFSEIEGGNEGSADFPGPIAAGNVGDVDQGFGTITLAGRKRRGQIGWKMPACLDQGGRGLAQPSAETVPQGIDYIAAMVVRPITEKSFCRPGTTQADRNAARSQGRRQRRVAGKSLGAKESEILFAASEVAILIRAGIQERNHGLALRRTEAVLVVIQQYRETEQGATFFH